jgi:hypothetical protein
LILDRPAQLLQCRCDGAALSVAQHHHQVRPELLCSKFHAADQRGGNYVAGHANDEKVAEALIEDDLDRYPRIGTAENGRERRLTGGQLEPARPARDWVAIADIRYEAAISLL